MLRLHERDADLHQQNTHTAPRAIPVQGGADYAVSNCTLRQDRIEESELRKEWRGGER